MPISIFCSRCNKPLKIKDEYIGKRIKCPQCSNTFTAEAAQAKGRGADAADKTVAIHLSTSAKAFLALLILIPGTFAAWKLGPGRIRDKWAQMEPKAQDDVKDVVDRGLEYYASSLIYMGPGLGLGSPHSVSIAFMPSPMPLSMPDWVGFVGSSTAGNMHGRYYLSSGEVEADVDFVVAIFAGPGQVRHETRTFHVTGRMKDNVLSAEVDGKPATVNWGHRNSR